MARDDADIAIVQTALLACGHRGDIVKRITAPLVKASERPARRSRRILAMRSFIDLNDQRFGSWTVLRLGEWIAASDAFNIRSHVPRNLIIR
jgi:hypothetical protein